MAVMEIIPIVATLRRNKLGAMLIALQIALTLAIVCNTLSVIEQHVHQIRRPSGIDEPNIFTMQNQWVGEPQDLQARIESDLAALRSLPGVVGAAATNGYPLKGVGGGGSVSRHPDQHFRDAWTIAEYYVDEQGLAAFGVRLVGGRWFRADEIGVQRATEQNSPAAIIITEPLARFLFPNDDAVGQVVYLASPAPTRVIGVVERTETPWAGLKHMEGSVERSAFLPYRYVNNGLWYVVRTQPGQQAAVMKAAQDRLYDLTGSRILDNVTAFSVTRQLIYARGRSSSLILGTLSLLLLTVTAFGVVGLTSYWVGQRRRQIGMRRALGARRLDIMRYFHLENLLVAGCGVVLGIGLCLAVNLWLAHLLAVTRIGLGYIGVGALLLLVLSQLAVIWPALRAASIPPAIATRGL
jgi:putative ABC transport system permease protein